MSVVPGLLPDAPAVPFARELAAFGDRVAVVTADGTMSYRELAGRVEQVARRLGPQRRLVLLAGANEVGALVGYLAGLAAGHPVLLVPGDKPEASESLIAAYDPDVVLRSAGEECVLEERRRGSAHLLHDDLALLLSTSGSTGSPKLVRLSHGNLQANAESIATYLGIRSDDRAATTLPMHYCYGLSVINSHLLRGAGLVLTGLSVADACFWDLFRAAGATSLAGVPYTFDLLDRVGFADLELPTVRYLTQAGGRMAPERVAAYAALGRRKGWDLYVMYGQTEATARMAYLPPGLAESRPEAIGGPIPGGSFRLRPLADWPEPDTGELVYSGPNVMLGYAESPADLRQGRTVEELPTGDVARLASDGLYEVIGRRSGFVKILGLRIEPQRVEALLRNHGFTAGCFGDDRELVVAVAGPADPDRVRSLVATTHGLAPRAVRVCVLPELPRLASGKIDYPAVREATRPADPERSAPAAGTVAGLRQLYAEVLGHAEVTETDTFVGLGGDSLSYVELSVRLERALGEVPRDWHLMPIRDLLPPAHRAVPSRWRWLETTVALRAAAIVLIVGSHIPLFMVKGGAHLLLGVAGFNFARFQLGVADRAARVRGIRHSIGRIAVPSMIWIALVYPLTDDYGPANLVLLHSVVGPATGNAGWHFWFIEALVYLLVAACALLGIPAVDRWERRHPFGLPLAVLALGLVTRYNLLGFTELGRVPSALVVFWLFAIGWAAARATNAPQRLVVTVAALTTVPGFFGEPLREAVIMAGLTLLIWVPRLPSLAVVNRLAGLLAGSSLYIYLTHWQVFPWFAGHSRLLALLVSLGAGVAASAVATRVAKSARRRRPPIRRRSLPWPRPRGGRDEAPRQGRLASANF